MFKEPLPESFRPDSPTCVAGVNGIWLAGDGPDNRVRIEDEARFGSLLDDFNDPRVFAPKRRSNPDARGIPDNLHEARDGISASPWIGERNFVGSQSNDHEVGVIIPDESRQFSVPRRGVRRLCAAHFVQGAHRLHFRP